MYGISKGDFVRMKEGHESDVLDWTDMNTLKKLEGKVVKITTLCTDDNTIRLDLPGGEFLWFPLGAFEIAKEDVIDALRFTIDEIGRAVCALKGWDYDEHSEQQGKELKEFLKDYPKYLELKEKYKNIS